jgi:hypothetical protein
MAVCERFLEAGLKPISIISRQAVTLGSADIGEGAISCGLCTITNQY